MWIEIPHTTKIWFIFVSVSCSLCNERIFCLLQDFLIFFKMLAQFKNWVEDKKFFATNHVIKLYLKAITWLFLVVENLHFLGYKLDWTKMVMSHVVLQQLMRCFKWCISILYVPSVHRDHCFLWTTSWKQLLSDDHWV